MLDEGLRLCQSGSLDLAEPVFRNILAIDAGTPDAWNMLAVVLHDTGRMDEAWDCSLQATRLRPHIPQYWMTRGNIALSRLKYPDAESGFASAAELAPDFPEAHYRLALVYHRQHRIDAAIASYRTALRYAPHGAEIYFKLAEALNEAGSWADALRAYEAAFARDPGNELPRGNALNLINRLGWDSLPEFWQIEISREFQREDIDKNRNVVVALRALKVRPAFRAMLAQECGATGPDQEVRSAVMSDALFLQLLRDALIADQAFEAMLTRMRAAFLAENAAREQAPLEFLVALATQCFNGEFIYAEKSIEREQLVRLRSELECAMNASAPLDPSVERLLAVIGMYDRLDNISSVVAYFGAHPVSPTLSPLIQRTLTEPAIEGALRQAIGGGELVTDEVSAAVREMYEEHPYPRWFSMDRTRPIPLRDWIDRTAPMAAAAAAFAPHARVLVAGCGTGHEAIELAAGLSDVQVLAVDLSCSSLAYAQRMAADLGVANIQFRHGDILGLGTLAERFSMIYCNGVLHHLRDPAEGLRMIAQLLQPGGLLRLSLYSALARASVTAARATISAAGIPATVPAIREFRQFVLQQARDSALAPLRRFLDFYSMSMCRDLMFHVQEHQMRLPQIAAMLAENNLTLVEFTGLAPDATGAYLRAYPDDVDMTDFSNWDEFEVQNPRTFDEMYQFWCAKRHSAP